MTGIYKIKIEETVSELKSLMKQQENSLNFAKVQTLYLLKIQAAETIRHVAVLIGRDERTIQRWLKDYREGGMTQLLEEHKPTGRPKKISVEEAAIVQNELRDPEGFKSYQELYFWLKIFLEVSCSYLTVYRLARYELQAKLKVARPQSRRQLPGEVEVFKENLSEQLKALLKKDYAPINLYQKISFWCGDESRFGLHTIRRRKLTLKGVKPVGEHQFNFQYFWIYGAVEPQTGRSFFYEFSHLDSFCFSQFLEFLSQAYPTELLILQVDNAPAHTASEVELPENIILFFQPPYCPEVNPIERLWEYLKNFLAWELFQSLEHLREKLDKLLASLSQKVVGYLTGWSWILQSLCLSGL